MIEKVLESIMKEVPECLGAGVFDYKQEKELGAITHLPDYNPDAAARAYSFIVKELESVLIYLPDRFVGKLEGLIVSSKKANFIIYRIGDSDLILVAAIPPEGNLGLLDIIMRRAVSQLEKGLTQE